MMLDAMNGDDVENKWDKFRKWTSYSRPPSEELSAEGSVYWQRERSGFHRLGILRVLRQLVNDLPKILSCELSLVMCQMSLYPGRIIIPLDPTEYRKTNWSLDISTNGIYSN